MTLLDRSRRNTERVDRTAAKLDAQANAAPPGGADGDGNGPGQKRNTETLAQAIDRLTTLPSLEYDRIREEEAKRLKVRVGTLDTEVRKRRRHADGDGVAAKGRAIELDEPEPWPAPVDGAAALDAADRALRRHMRIRPEHAAMAVLWAAHTHVYDAFSHTPRLGITAPDAECGKTLLMVHLVGALVTRPLPVELMKPAPFFRLAESHRPCFLISEVDVFIKEDSDLLAAVNNGWEPHGGVLRCVGEGADMAVRLFSTHTPVAFDGINLRKVLPATTLGRTLLITLERATESEIEEAYDARKHHAELRVIGRQLARWCADQSEILRTAEPALPPGATGRRADRWRPLFALAQAAGGDWPARVRNAYLAEDDAPKLSLGLQLLADIRRVWKPDEHKLHTEVLIERLCELEGSRWAVHNFRATDEEQRRLQPRQLSALLKDYGITPADRRIGPTVRKGYVYDDIIDACRRYLPASATPLHPSGHAASGESPSATAEPSVADGELGEATPGTGCSGVADAPTPGPRGEEDEAPGEGWSAEL